MIIVLPLMLAQIITNDPNAPPETVTAQGYGVIQGKVYQKNWMGDYRISAWTEVTATSTDGSFTESTSTDGNGTYTLLVPPGEYNVTIWAPYHSDPNYFWFNSTIVSVHTGTATMNFYLDEPIPEFSDYMIAIVFTIALLSSALLIRRMKRRSNTLPSSRPFH